MGYSGTPSLKNGHFCQKIASKCQFSAKKQCFLGSGGHFKATPPNLQEPDAKKHVLEIIGASEYVCQGLPDLKNAIMCHKMA